MLKRNKNQNVAQDALEASAVSDRGVNRMAEQVRNFTEKCKNICIIQKKAVILQRKTT